jgi:hypothetical protein
VVRESVALDPWIERPSSFDPLLADAGRDLGPR